MFESMEKNKHTNIWGETLPHEEKETSAPNIEKETSIETIEDEFGYQSYHESTILGHGISCAH